MNGENQTGRSIQEQEMRSKYGMAPIWVAIGEIYREFASVCEKLGLRHYAAGGTALGAIRHGGFIPWDDDIDIVMPRADYEKFIEAAKGGALPEHLKIVNRYNTPEFLALFSKIQDTRREVVEEVERKTGRTLSNGLFIDFYPMDGYPRRGRWLWTKVRIMALESMWRRRFEKFGTLTFKGKVAWIAGMLASPFFPRLKDKTDFMRAYDTILRENPYEGAEIVSDIGYVRNVFILPKMRRAFFGRPTPHRFEDFIMMLPEDIEGYCQNKFGRNYMELPPERCRQSTHVCGNHYPWWLGPTR